MTIRLYFDEDASATDLIQALRLRGVDVVGVADAGMRERGDDQQLEWATSHGRVLYSFNRGDFCRIHSRLMRAGKTHSGIILSVQQHYSIGEQMRRLLTLMSKVSGEEMRNRIEFLSSWSVEGVS